MASERKPIVGAGQRAKILVVDDERAVREMVHDALEGPEWEVSLAGDGKQALSFLEWDFYNLLILDLRLPDTDGLALLRRIKERSPDTEMVILSGHADLATAVEALRLGAADYLRKPLDDVSLLRKAVLAVLERQELRLANRYLMDELQRANRELQRQRRRELRRLEEVGLALAGALQRDDVLEVLQRAIPAAVSCDILALYLFAPELGGPSLRVRSQWPLQDRLLDALRGAAELAGVRADDLERATVNAEVTVLARQPSVPPAALGTATAIPLASHGVCRGLVAVAAARAEAFAPEAVQLLRILCNQTAVALENAMLFQQAQLLATRDGLTGLYNHRFFYQRLEEEISRSVRHHTPLTLVILDSDGLKQTNDSLGHLAGDELLRTYAKLIPASVRMSDIVARYGGDEFAILLPHTTPEAARALCERVRQKIEEYHFEVNGRVVQLGASFGVAGFDPLSEATGIEVVRWADEALYRAKNGGKNRIELAVSQG
jgi:two-component system, cell cycle response regulator